MERISLRLAGAIFAVAFTITNARSAGFYPTSGRNAFEPIAHASALVQKKRTFKFVSRSCESGCLEIYKSSDGQEVSLINACHTGSAEDVPEAMRSLMTDGKVLKRAWQRTKRGRRGERTVVLYSKDDTGLQPANIFWYRRGDICFWYIQAGSLKLALEFEQSHVAAKTLLN